MLNHTLYQIEEFSDIWADACLRDSEGRLMFLSVYGRDGVLMQMLAAFELGASQRGVNQIHLVGKEITIDEATGDVTIAVAGLADGKQRITLTPAAGDGRSGAPLRLIFWIEAEAFRWDDALIYMVMTDRFVDGDPGNNPGATPGADPRGDWQGGDLAGLRAAIADGTLDQLGVRAIWLTPFQTGPSEAFLASDGQHKVTGYHGYWPAGPRALDPHLGTEDDLRTLMRSAHRQGLRVLFDVVPNHVHAESPYATKSGWTTGKPAASAAR